MTGTALTEASEFMDIYGLEVIDIPTNVPVARSTKTTKSTAPITRSTPRSSAEAKRANPRPSRSSSARPRSKSRKCWPNTSRSTATSRSISPIPAPWTSCTAAARAGKPAKLFAVLNARFHEQEAYIVARSRRARRDHHRHQHGRPRYRHQARRLAGNANPARDRRNYRRSREGRQNRADQGRCRALPRHRAEGGRHNRDRARQGQQAGGHRDPAGRPLHHRLRTP